MGEILSVQTVRPTLPLTRILVEAISGSIYSSVMIIAIRANYPNTIGTFAYAAPSCPSITGKMHDLR